MSHIGKGLHKSEISHYESLPAATFDELFKELALLHKNGNEEDRITPLVIGEVDESEVLQ